MDESTSALDEPTEKKVMTELVNASMTLISVAHRSTLRAYHDFELHVTRNGTWTMSKIGPRASAQPAFPKIDEEPLTPRLRRASGSGLSPTDG